MTDLMQPLPQQYKERMRDLLGKEYDAFISSYEDERRFGLRINPLKVDPDDQKILNTILSDPRISVSTDDAVPWCYEGYYYDKDSCPGRSPYHEAGAYYIQEPSAMAVCEALDPAPGEIICDLCAAPGGKTTHIAGRMKGEGVLVSNEIVTDRARILSSNVERMGIPNCIVTNESPDVMAMRFAGFFDKVCVDAPCSGEGMFRKEPKAREEWSIDNVNMCADRQRMILDCAANMVTSGGILVYSTCTFEPAENEQVIASFLSAHPGWEIEDVQIKGMSTRGRNEWVSDKPDGIDLSRTVRIWPHISDGEGHFIARLKKSGNKPVKKQIVRNEDLKRKNVRLYDEVLRFLHTELLVTDVEDEDQVLKIMSSDHTGQNIIEFGDHIYMLPDGISKERLDGIRVIRPGLELAVRRKNRLEPAHALAMSVSPDVIRNRCNVNMDDAIRFMRGETIPVDHACSSDADNACNIIDGSWTVMTLNGITLGWGKYMNGIVKNHYPKGLRRDLS